MFHLDFRTIAFALLTASLCPRPCAAIEFTSYELRAQDGQKALVERGSFSVPENRSRPDGRRLELTIVRFPALRPTTRAPIVYLAGGPGGSGIDAARLPQRFAIFQALREVADVIALDQRGTGLSDRLPPCPTTGDLPRDRATTRESLTRAISEVAAACARSWREQGVDLSAYNTRESAADVEALRVALGVPKLSLWGISYGSHLGLAVLKYYPDHVERASFVGIEGLDETVKLPALTDGFYRRLQEAAAATHPDFLATMRRVHTRLEREPIPVTFRTSAGDDVTITLGLTDVRLATTMLSADPIRSRNLPALYSMMDAGDFSLVAPLAWESIRKPGALRVSGMGEAMDVASGISPQRLAKFERQQATSLLGDVVNFPMPHIGTALGVPDLGERFRSPFDSGVPTLFLSGTLDGRTYPESAAQLIRRFRNGKHLTVINGGHNLFEASPLIRDVIVAWHQGVAPASPVLSLPPPEFP